MLRAQIKYYFILTLVFFGQQLLAEADKFRVMWREDPATTMVVGWNQASGSDPVLLLDVIDHGTDALSYAEIFEPDHKTYAKGMNNHFVRLRNLSPNTIYYFVIRDSEGLSQRYSFKTAPNLPYERLSIIAGGDSRNNREARQDANRLVGKLRPHCVMFGGDMTGGDNAEQWNNWFDDWQLTIARDGRITPIIVTRGNHEQNNNSLKELFDVKADQLYYALSLGGDLLRVYTLNSLIPSGGNQRDWLERDLRASTNAYWKMAQYHHTIRPHTSKKPEKNEQLLNWSTLFHKFGVNLVVESDAHVVKSTWPIRPSRDPGSEEGFVRDDRRGTVYVGEGCWGAPLRAADDSKSWTRNTDSFNQFKWIFVDQENIEVRTVLTDDSRRVGEVSPHDVFTAPTNLSIWNPSNGSVIRIKPRRRQFADLPPAPPKEEVSTEVNENEVLASRGMEITDFGAERSGDDVAVRWKTKNEPKGLMYEIQRSTDGGKNYKSIGTLVGKGDDRCFYEWFDYDFAVNNPGTFVNYRLKRTLPNGKILVHDPSKPQQKEQKVATQSSKPTPPPPKKQSQNWDDFPKLDVSASTSSLSVEFALSYPANVSILLLKKSKDGMEAVKRRRFDNLRPGDYAKSLDIDGVAPGRYLLVIKANKAILRRYRVFVKP